MITDNYKQILLLQLVAVWLIFISSTFVFAEDYETPHIFKPGDVISADMMNELFKNIANSKQKIESADLVGTWRGTITSFMAIDYYQWNISYQKDPDNFYYYLEQMITFTDDGDGTYSWYSDGPCFFIPVLRVKDANGNWQMIDNPDGCTGKYAIKNSQIFICVDAEGGYRTEADIVRISETQIQIGSDYILDKIKIRPKNPTDLYADPIDFSIELTWTDNSSDETGFKILRKDTLEGVYAEIETTRSDAVTYEDVVPKSGTYWYRVCATNENGDSLGSNVVKVTIGE